MLTAKSNGICHRLLFLLRLLLIIILTLLYNQDSSISHVNITKRQNSHRYQTEYGKQNKGEQIELLPIYQICTFSI